MQINAFYFSLISQEFTGNKDRNTVVRHDLNPPITARFIRFQPVSWFAHISMRAELYGCLGGKKILFNYSSFLLIFASKARDLLDPSVLCAKVHLSMPKPLALSLYGMNSPK